MKVILYQLFLGGLILGAWELTSGKLIKTFWVSSPVLIWKCFVSSLLSGELIGHFTATIWEAFLGYFFGAFIGIITGFVLAQYKSIADVVEPYIMAINGIPRIALAPLFIVWFGIGILSKVILVCLVVAFLTFYNTYSGIKETPSAFKDVVRVMGGSEWQIISKVVFPATLPWIVTGLKMSVPYALVGAIAAEFIASTKGLGYLIALSSNMFNTTATMMGIIILALTVLSINRLLDYTEKKLFKWRTSDPQKPKASDLY